jgi:hypothetical protein
MGQSRGVILLVVISLSFVAPAALCAAAAWAPAPSFVHAALIVLAAASWMTLLALVNWWEFTSVHLRWAWLVALAGIAVYRLAGAGSAVGRGLPVTAPIDLSMLLALALSAAGAWLTLGALAARRPAGQPIDAAFPLSAGTYLVTDGGDGTRSFLVNYHYGFGRHRASGVSASMRYALDVVAIGPWGGESRGVLPRDNEAYRIWRQVLHAPCAGRVVHVVSDVADNDAFGANRPYGVGNHVVLRATGDTHVVLGHLARGSVTVAVGQDVAAGDAIGLVGNSGWTERPHLHMQAMHAADGDWWHGDPLPISFGGRFLVRNDVVRA